LVTGTFSHYKWKANLKRKKDHMKNKDEMAKYVKKGHKLWKMVTEWQNKVKKLVLKISKVFFYIENSSSKDFYPI